jgi:uncharacterized protein (TIGR03000 family)
MRTLLLVAATAALVSPLGRADEVRQAATIVVAVPADAKLSFDGAPTRQTGAIRTFTTPALPAGKDYSYEIKVEAMRQGKPAMHTRRVTVRAGETTRIEIADLRPTASASGYVYTIDNDPAKNGVAVLKRNADGSLSEVADSPFPAGGKGLTGGDIDEQGAIRLHGNHVLAVNPGSDSIAVFQKGDQGRLIPVPGSPFPSNGNNPLSLAVHGDLVYVANQAPPFAHPTAKPNVTGFRISTEGKLTPIANSTITFPAGQGPAQIEFSPDGKTVAVTAGFQDEPASRVHSFTVKADGTLKEGLGSAAKPEGASGVVGFSWAADGKHVYVSNFRGSAVTVFTIDPDTAAIKQVGGASGDDEKAACWTALARDGKTLYVANFVSNSISVFDVAPDGKLKLLGTTKRRGGTSPDTKDLEVSKDGKFLYAVASGAKEIAVFRIGADRLLTELPEGKSPLKLRTGQNVTGLVAD